MERVESPYRDPDFERSIEPRRRTAKRRWFGWPLIVLVLVVVAGVFLWRAFHEAEAPVTDVPPTAAAPKAAEAPSAPAGPRYPIEAVAPPGAAAQTPLPAVADSDATLQDTMGTLFVGAPLDRIFHLQEIVPRFVATIDNLPRQTVALSRMAVKPVEGTLETSRAGEQILLRADNATRYAPYLSVMENVDTKRLVATYVRYYPLLQKAYEDLGYPHGYFNDRLVEVIDHLLVAPDVPAPIALAQPKVLYQFADPSLEQLSAGQKILVRMGPVGEARVKTKLRDIRRALTAQKLPK